MSLSTSASEGGVAPTGAADPVEKDLTNASATHALVKDYYGKALSRSEDLKTTACAVAAAANAGLSARLAKLHPETVERFFGCGLIAPEAIAGAHVLDLGCGAGRDVYVLAQMVGPDGFVAGVDMTPEQLAVARAHEAWHRDSFGYARSNVAFHEGLLEKLDETPLAPASFDVAVSNCVINLVPDKQAALAGVKRLLKPGGEFFFADVYADRALDPAIRNDPVLYGECLGGALAWRDFMRMAVETGFARPRLTEAAPISATSDAVAAKLGDARFVSATYRLFVVDPHTAQTFAGAPSVEAEYLGGVEGADEALSFDQAHRFVAGAPQLIDRETAAILAGGRFAPFFRFARSEAPIEAPEAADPFLVASTSAAAPAANGCCG